MPMPDNKYLKQQQQQQKPWLSAVYVPGKNNVEVDEESRKINFYTE